MPRNFSHFWYVILPRLLDFFSILMAPSTDLSPLCSMQHSWCFPKDIFRLWSSSWLSQLGKMPSHLELRGYVSRVLPRLSLQPDRLAFELCLQIYWCNFSPPLLCHVWCPSLWQLALAVTANEAVNGTGHKSFLFQDILHISDGEAYSIDCCLCLFNMTSH